MASGAHASFHRPIITARRSPRLLLGVLVSGLLASGAIAAVSATSAQAATAGTVDTTFGTNGSVTTDVTSVLGPFVSFGGATALPSGDIVVADALGLVRLLPTGKPDASFGAAGFASAPGSTDNLIGTTGELALQPDGKIVWAGSAAVTVEGSQSTVWEVARFNASGTLDASFGTGGVVTTELFAPASINDEEIPTAIVVQPDGKIVVGGVTSQALSNRGAALLHGNAVVRYNPNGTLDTSFGAGGKVLTGNFGPGATVVSGNVTFTPGELGLDSAGDVFIAPGSAHRPGVFDGLTTFSQAEAELSPSGSPDASVTAAPITAASNPALLASGQFEQAANVSDVRQGVTRTSWSAASTPARPWPRPAGAGSCPASSRSGRCPAARPSWSAARPCLRAPVRSCSPSTSTGPLTPPSATPAPQPARCPPGNRSSRPSRCCKRVARSSW